jgi:hypothetical protein
MAHCSTRHTSVVQSMRASCKVCKEARKWRKLAADESLCFAGRCALGCKESEKKEKGASANSGLNPRWHLFSLCC